MNRPLHLQGQRQRADDVCAIVFQMGKVASTAITKALASLEGVEAHHSHFLGEEALTRVLSIALKPENNDYFFHHQMGQLAENACITRAAQKVRAQKDPRRLVVLSLTREPFSWLQSSILQDIEGFAPMLQATDGSTGIDLNDDPSLREGLSAFLEHFADALEAFDTIEDFVVGMRRTEPAVNRFSQGERQLAMSALRPSLWFEQNFPMGLDLKVSQFERSGKVWRFQEERAQFGIIRYEDPDTAFPEFCAWTFGTTPELHFENESHTKKQVQVVADAFKTEGAMRVQRALKRSEYAVRFGYA